MLHTMNSMSMSKRQPLLPDTIGPSPWSYNLPSKLGKEGPRAILSGKTLERQTERSPGPTTYRPNFEATLSHVPIFKLGTAPRDDKTFYGKRNVPGPGQYKLNETFDGPRYKFHKSKKLGLQINETTPGPGTYRIPCSFANTATYILPNRNERFKFV